MLVIGWILFSFIPAVIASNKGRSGGGWFLLSLCITPLFAGILVACLPPLRAEVEQRAVASGDVRKCPYCAELVKAEAKICRYCQRELPSLYTPAPPDPEFPVAAIPTECPDCHHGRMVELTKGRRYLCPQCSRTYEVTSVASSANK